MSKRPARSPRRKNLPSNLPTTLLGATEFSADPIMGNVDWTVQSYNELVKTGQIRDIAGEIEQFLDTGEGRPRDPGSPFKAFVAYTTSKKVGVETFWNDFGQNVFWKASGYKFKSDRDMGFGYRPAFQSVWRWFAELEHETIVDMIERAGDELIQIARTHDPEIGKNVSIDFTPFLSPSRAYHVCRGCHCPRAKGKQKKSRARMHTQQQRLDATDVSRRRHEEAKAEPIPSTAEERREIRKRSRRTFVDRTGQKWVAWRNTNGCLLICMDTSAGGRSYDDGKKAWVGGYRGAAKDMKYGGTMASVCFGAHRREHAAVPALLRKTERAMSGERPEAITGDRGISMDKVYWLLERRNIDPVLPWRIPNASVPTMAHERTELWDEDGPRCKHCGGPTTHIGPRLGRAIVNGEPVVRYRCLLENTQDCYDTILSIPCRMKPRILTGVSKESERYQALKGLHDNMERTFNEDRARFGLSGKDNTLRLRRRGVEAQRLRAAVSRYLEWMFICLRHGWIGSHAYRNLATATPRSGFHGVQRIKRIRRHLGLLLPYGPKAFKLGLAATPDVPKPPPPAKKTRGGP